MVRRENLYIFQSGSNLKTHVRHQIPKPPRAYWAKLQGGQRLERQPLPMVAGQEKEIRIGYLRQHRPVPPPDALIRTFENVVVQPDLLNTHKLVKDTRKALRSANRVVPGAKANGGKIFSPIPELAVQVFKEWKLRSGVRSGLLFTIHRELIEYRQIQYKYDQALKNAKLPFTATHILRHASLTEAYSTSFNILAVQRLAGHKSLKATEKYAKVRDEQVAEVQRGMDVKLSSVLRGI